MKTDRLFLEQKGIRKEKRTTVKEELKKLTWAYDLRKKMKPLLKDIKLFHPTETKKAFIKRERIEHYTNI